MSPLRSGLPFCSQWTLCLCMRQVHGLENMHLLVMTFPPLRASTSNKAVSYSTSLIIVLYLYRSSYNLYHISKLSFTRCIRWKIGITRRWPMSRKLVLLGVRIHAKAPMAESKTTYYFVNECIFSYFTLASRVQTERRKILRTQRFIYVNTSSTCRKSVRRPGTWDQFILGS